MNVLGIDTSGTALGVAVAEGLRPVASTFLDVGYRHGERLVPAIAAVMSSAGLGRADLDAVAVTSGPGSFTGLRVGITCARTLAWSLGCLLVGVPTLDALAFNARLHRGVVCACVDARRGAVFAASYRWQSPPAPGDVARCRITSPRWIQMSDLLPELAAMDVPVILVGAAAREEHGRTGWETVRPGAGIDSRIRPETVALMGGALASASAGGPMPLAPLYLRRSGAEGGPV